MCFDLRLLESDLHARYRSASVACWYIPGTFLGIFKVFPLHTMRIARPP